jgi:hypothetical protein
MSGADVNEKHASMLEIVKRTEHYKSAFDVAVTCCVLTELLFCFVFPSAALGLLRVLQGIDWHRRVGDA